MSANSRYSHIPPVDLGFASRREFLTAAAGGLGSIALSCLLHEESAHASTPSEEIGPVRPHYAPRAKRVIQIFCCGGISHIDTFDYKPELARLHGMEMSNKGKVDTFFNQPGRLMKTPFAFKQHGQSDRWVSSLLPNLAGCVDDMTFIHSMRAKSANHTPATFQMNSGFTMNGFPCLGSWLSYGLGTENQDLPAFVVLPDPRGLPAGGAINWTSGFLPATTQGVPFNTRGNPVDDLNPPNDVSRSKRQASLALLDGMNRDFLHNNPGDSAIAARIKSYELAARMQASIPQVIDLSHEPEHIQKMYGLDNPATQGFARNCLMARRLLEKGVRFVQMYHGGAFGSPRINWDAHEDIVENHTRQAANMDQPVAALLKDLKARGMLEDTLVLHTTEFGRLPITQGIGSTGRDHHPHGFTIWMAGAGLKPGMALGSTDEIGYFAAEKPQEVYDLHATVLHLLGLDHKKLTYYYNGIQRRITDVHGNVIREVLA
ncbi:MAG: DUF1501 domain-containing protein [Chthonomonadales bacterium]